jgi:Flp pilus assembly protein TadD
MSNAIIQARRALLSALAIVLCCSAGVAQGGQHGSGPGGGTAGGAANAGTTMKVPKKTTRPSSSTRPRPGPRPTAPDNTAQMEDALSLADDARQAGNTEVAERNYLRASNFKPTDPRPFMGLGHLYYNQKKYNEAEKHYAKAASLARNDSEPYARLAFTYTELNRLDEALTAGRRSVAAEPTDYYGYLALGYVLSLRRSYAEAETTYRKSISLAPQPLIVLHLELARILGEQRRYNDALTEANRAVEIDPKNYSARFNKALMLQKLGQLTPSATQYLEAIRLNPKDSSPHSNVGLIYYMTENYAAARRNWARAVELGSTYAPDRIGLLILNSRLTEAQTQLEEYTKKTPEDEDGWLMLGDVYRALGNDSAARVTDARAAQIAPEYVGLKRPNLKTLNRTAGGPATPTNTNTGGPTTPSNTGGWSSGPTNRADVFIQKVYMARDNNGQPGSAVTSFFPYDRTIHCVIELSAAKAGTRVRFIWRTVDVSSAPNQEIKTVDYVTKPQEDIVKGNLSLPRDWPTGTYKVEIYINGSLAKTVNYRIT